MRQSLLYLLWPPWAAWYKQKLSYFCRTAQGGQGKYSSDCHVSISPKVSLYKLRQCKRTEQDHEKTFWWTNTLAYLSLLPATKKKRFWNIERWHQFKCHHNFPSYCDFFENGSAFFGRKTLHPNTFSGRVVRLAWPGMRHLAESQWSNLIIWSRRENKDFFSHCINQMSVGQMFFDQKSLHL